MSSVLYQRGLLELAQQNLDVEGSSDLVIIPMSASYTPDPEAHETISDVNSDELDADGYTQGFGSADRKTPSNRSWSRNDSPDGGADSRLELSHDDVTWPDLGGGVSDNNDVVGGFLYAEERTDDADSPIFGFDTLQDDRDTNGADVTHSTAPDGSIHLVTNPS